MPNTIYANARASALWNGLLGKERLLRMAESDGVEEAVKILSEVNFGGEAETDSASDFEPRIRSEEEKLADFVRETSPTAALRTFLLAEYDFHNAEALLRAKFLRKDAKEMTGISGEIDRERLEDRISGEDYRGLPEKLRKALEEGERLFLSEQADGRSVGTVFRRGLYDTLREASEGDRLLAKLFSARADAANIGMALRARNVALAREMAVAGGSLREADLRYLCEESPEAIRAKYRFTAVSGLVGRALDALADGKPLTAFETESADVPVRVLEKSRYDAGGALPFVRYCFEKRAECANVRLILTGIRSGLDRADLKGRMRACL